MSFRCFGLLVISTAALEGSARGAEMGREVDDAIDAGIRHLLKAVEGREGWTPAEKFPAGYAALQVYALVKCDVSFQHPVLQKGLAIVQGAPFEQVYSVSLDLMAHGAMVEQIDADARLGSPRPAAERAQFLDRMQKALAWLISARLRGVGAWNYEPLPARADPKTHRFDHSNTQFAVLALGVGAAHKLKVPPEIWEEIVDHFLRTQETTGPEVTTRPVFRGDGEDPRAPAPSGKTTSRKTQPLYEGESLKVQARGWKYIGEDFDEPKFSMTCAGLSSLLLAQKHLGPPALSGARGESLRRSLRDGYGWVTVFLDSMKTPFPRMFGLQYDLYSLEKVGDIGEVASFGSFQWYEEGARKLLVTQKSDGSWPAGREEAHTRSNTALALLFLARATDLGGRARPLQRVTRAGGAPLEQADRIAWLYLPSQKAEVPLVRLFRLFRYRPSKQVTKMVEEAVKVFDPQRLHELVRGLAVAVSESPFAAVQAQARKLLVQVTGVDSREESEYGVWADRHEEVVRIGKAAEKNEAATPLREWLGTAQGTPLKAKVIWAIERTGGRAAIPDLIDLLEASDPVLRESAYGALTFLTGQSHPFHPRGAEKSRAEEVRVWREWHRTEAQKSGQ